MSARHANASNAAPREDAGAAPSSTASIRHRETPAHAEAPQRTESPLTGTMGLVRLHLRLDRVRLIVWTLAMGLGVWSSVAAMQAAYPTAESLQSRAELMTNPSAIMMTGPAFAVDNSTFAAMVANELSLYVLLAAGIMSILVAVRHTRADEESGRLELIWSLPVGRFAPQTASVITAGISNLLVGAAVAAGLLAAGLEGTDSLAFGVATAATGMVFAAIATASAQLTEHARSATGMAMAALAVAFLVRGVGDVIDNQGSWLSWFSPFAWAQQTRLFVDLRWWPLLVSLAVIVAAYGLAVAFSLRRDLGAGLRRPTPGAATASRALRSPGGLAERLMRGSAIAWAIGTFFFAVAMGALANSVEGMLDDNPALAEWIALEGTDLVGQFAGLILSFVLVAPVIVAVGAVLRLSSEEQSGRVEHLVVASRSRTGLLTGWFVVAAVETAVLTALAGLGVGLGVAAATGDGGRIGEMLLASLVYLPAVWLVTAIATFIYGLAPRAGLVAWLLVVWIALVLFLGDLLQLPDWAKGLSPFHHTPALPTDELDWVPLLVMGGMAIALAAIGVALFRRRDIESR